MKLSKTLKLTALLYLIGMLAFFYLQGMEALLWFAIGGGLALMNVFLGVIVIRRGLSQAKRPAFLGMLLLKSMTFVATVAVILMFIKPLILPFTLGITIVIVGAVMAAVWESRQLIINRN